jgi:hypothetical protein
VRRLRNAKFQGDKALPSCIKENDIPKGKGHLHHYTDIIKDKILLIFLNVKTILQLLCV